MAANSFLAPDVDIPRLAEATKNFSGAELEGLVKSAASFALNRNVDINDLHKPLDEDNIKARGRGGAFSLTIKPFRGCDWVGGWAVTDLHKPLDEGNIKVRGWGGAFAYSL